MTPKHMKIRQEDRAASGAYACKARDNYDAMMTAWEAGNYNAAGTLALQCAISSADAVCVHEKGVRSISQDHFDVCELMCSIPRKDAAEKSTALKRVIAKKNLVQYEHRALTQREAEEMVKIVSRFYQWMHVIVNSEQF